MRDGGSVTFGSFCGEPPTCARLEPAVCFKFSAPACPFAQPEHHRLFPSDGIPKGGCFRPQPSHSLLATSTAPACPFAQPAHHRLFPSDANPKLGTFRPQSSQLFPALTAPACAFAQPQHQRFFPSDGSP